MIDLAEHKGAIQWLERGMTELAGDPDNPRLRDGVLLSFEVTYNISERVLRQALSEFTDDPRVPYLSSRELMRYAIDEGIPLCSGEAWLRYGLALESANETLGETFCDTVLPLLPQYARELRNFAAGLEGRMVPVA